MRNSDIGRPFTDLVGSLQYPEIDDHARQVIKNLTTVETSIIPHNERRFNIRILTEPPKTE